MTTLTGISPDSRQLGITYSVCPGRRSGRRRADGGATGVIEFYQTVYVSRARQAQNGRCNITEASYAQGTPPAPS